jgi:hypothetical protein
MVLIISKGNLLREKSIDSLIGRWEAIFTACPLSVGKRRFIKK